AAVRRHAPAPEPIAGVGQQLVAATGATNGSAVLECRLGQRHRRSRTLPPNEAKHGVFVVERHPGACVHVARELAVWYLCPERKQEVAETPIGLTRSRRAIARILRAPGLIGQMIL